MVTTSILSLTLLAVATAVFGAPSATPNCSRFYTVVSGDTCDSISAKENVSSFQLATVNAGIINAGCTNLAIGEVLCLGIIGQDCEVTQVVVQGDSCITIANEADTTLDVLLANNPNVNAACTNLSVGEVLCVANTVIVSST